MTSAFIPGAAAFRFYEDGTESGSSAIAAQDVNLTARDVNSDSQVHLRYRLDEVGSGNVDGATTDDYALEFERNGTGGFSAVTTSSSFVQVDTGSTLSDGSATTDRATEGISAGIGAFLAGEQEDGNGEITDHQLLGNQHTEHVWALLLISANLVDTDFLDFRVTLNGGGPGMTNSITPRITVSKGTVHTFTDVADLSQSQLLDTAGIIQNHIIVFDDLIQGQLLDQTVITQDHVIASDDLSQSQLSDTAVITQNHAIASDDLLQSQIIDTASLITVGVLNLVGDGGLVGGGGILAG